MIKQMIRFFAVYLLTDILLILAFTHFTGLTEEQALTTSLILFFLSLALFILSKIKRKSRKQPVHGRQKNRQKSSLHLFISVFLPAAVLCTVFYAFFIRQDSIPASLTELREKYPETSGFVSDYPSMKNVTQNMDVSDEIEKGKIPLFIQWDERWGYKTYGSNFFAVTACGPTCLSMVICGLTGEAQWNPYEVAKFSEEQGYYIPGEGTSWELMTTGADALGLNASYGDISAEFILGNLSPSSPMICSMYPGDFTYTGHFIVLTGIDENGKIIVNDPNSRINSEKHWDMDVLLPQIRSLWIYTYYEW